MVQSVRYLLRQSIEEEENIEKVGEMVSLVQPVISQYSVRDPEESGHEKKKSKVEIPDIFGEA